MIHRVVVLAGTLLLASTAGRAVILTETAGPWYVASPTFYGSANSGTYYFPSVVALGSNAFLFAQGGQFTPGTVPSTVLGTFSSSNHCEGDKITMWRGPLSMAGMQAPFTQIRLVSRCDSNSSVLYHWSPSGAYLQAANGPVTILAERQGLSGGTQVSSSVWWYRGVPNSATNPTDIPAWTLVKLFDTAPSVGRVACCTMARDFTRGTPPPDRVYTRGYGIRGQSTFEARFEFSTNNQTFARIELKDGNAWRPVLNNLLDFTPTTHVTNFRARNILNRSGVLEVWGSTVSPTASVNCPCVADNAAQNSWYTIVGNSSGGNWTLAGVNLVVEANPKVRCNPAGPAAIRNGSEIITTSGVSYLFSEQNWEGIDPVNPALPCPDKPFVGMDVVTVKVQ